MAQATYRQKINGKVYEVGDELPNYGSLVFLENEDSVVYIEGKSADFSKLPTWVKFGSTAYMIDNQKAYKFDGTEWIEQ